MTSPFLRLLLGEGRFTQLWRGAPDNPVVEMHDPARRSPIYRFLYFWSPYVLVLGGGILPMTQPLWGGRSSFEEMILSYSLGLMLVVWFGCLPISVFAFLLFAAKNPGKERLQELMLTPLTHEEIVFGHMYWGVRAALRTFIGVSIPLAAAGLVSAIAVAAPFRGNRIDDLAVGLSVFVVLLALTFHAQVYALVHGARGFLREQYSPWRSLLWTPLRAAVHVGWAIACILVAFLVTGGTIDAIDGVIRDTEWLALPAAGFVVTAFSIPLLWSISLLARRMAREAPVDFFAGALEEAIPEASRESVATVLEDSRLLVTKRLIPTPTIDQQAIALVADGLAIAACGFFFHFVAYSELLSFRYSYNGELAELSLASPPAVAMSVLLSGTAAAVFPSLAWLAWAWMVGALSGNRVQLGDDRVPLATVAAHARGTGAAFLLSILAMFHFAFAYCVPFSHSIEESVAMACLVIGLWFVACLGIFVATVHGVALSGWPRLSAFLATLLCLSLLIAEMNCWQGPILGVALPFGRRELPEIVRLSIVAICVGSVFVNTIPEARSKCRRPPGGLQPGLAPPSAPNPQHPA